MLPQPLSPLKSEDMTHFLYFAYGSNMLTPRLRERCPSASPIGTARAAQHTIAFIKKGGDGSGKATLVPLDDHSESVWGVLYRIHRAERRGLDRAEARYRRHDSFPVRNASDGGLHHVTTYIARADACREDLCPFDWYVALMEAGAREHGLDADYIACLIGTTVRQDPDARRAKRMMALANHRLGS